MELKKQFPAWGVIQTPHKQKIRAALKEDEQHDLTIEAIQTAMLTAFPYYGDADRNSIESTANDIFKEYQANGFKD